MIGEAQRLQGQGKLAEAEPLFRRALEGRERLLGAQHLDTLICVGRLASLLHAQGELAEAEALYRRTLEGCEQQLGKEHPDTLESAKHMAALLEAQGKLKLTEAERLAVRREGKGGRTHASCAVDCAGRRGCAIS